jgi:SlyX protein
MPYPRAMTDDPAVPAAVEHRLVELEIKASLAEDLVERLNDVVARQQTQIGLLAREVARLVRERQAAAEDGTAQFRSLRDEIPPHY